MFENREYFWYKLFRTNGIGPKTLAAIQRVLERENIDPEAVSLNKRDLEVRYPQLGKILGGKIKEEDDDSIYREYKELRDACVTIIYPGHSHCPPVLLEDGERFGVSPVLFGKGNTNLLNNGDSKGGVAIVGSRDVSKEGADAARRIASDLARSGFNVVSGYAKGIDTEAHIGALEAEGTSTMVLSYGIFAFRPKRGFDTFRFDQNCVAVSQFSPHERWRARNAMSRNKLVCALSRAVIVIESGPERDSAGKMSGTFDAGMSALKMGRVLFVVSPEYFKGERVGNTELLKQRGSIKLDPYDSVSVIEKELRNKENSNREDQNSLFAGY